MYKTDNTGIVVKADENAAAVAIPWNPSSAGSATLEEKWENMNWEMTLLVERRKGREEGRAEGRVEGRAEGKDIRVVDQILKKNALGQPEEKIAEDLLADQSFVHDVLCIAAQTGDPTAEKIYDVYEQKKQAAETAG